MKQVNMHEAKTHLSKLVEELEAGREDEIVVARNGRPVARLTAVGREQAVPARIGVAKEAFTMPPPSVELDDAVAALFAAERPSEER